MKTLTFIIENLNKSARKVPANADAHRWLSNGLSRCGGDIELLAERIGKAMSIDAQRAIETERTTGNVQALYLVRNMARTILQSAVFSLHLAVRQEERKEARKARVGGWTLDTSKVQEQVAITPDAWADDATAIQADEYADTAPAGTSQDPDKYDVETETGYTAPPTVTEWEATCTFLYEAFLAPCMAVQGIIGDLYSEPLAFGTAPRADGTYAEAGSLEEALQWLRSKDEYRAMQERDIKRTMLSKASEAWAA